MADILWALGFMAVVYIVPRVIIKLWAIIHPTCNCHCHIVDKRRG